jgi:hypothetical protein
MAKRKPYAKKSKPKSRTAKFCSVPQTRPREFGPDVTPGRERLIVVSDQKWANGTTLHYYFFTSPARWSATSSQKTMVRNAFKRWKELGIGLEFKEVTTPDEAEIRIGFQSGDGHWSYLGRGVLRHGSSERTMNLDKSAGNFDIDTAAHEIGHSLGFPHEHQNPNSGIEWNEEAVYAALALPPNNWSREETHWNILRKIRADTVQGSSWDPDSIMHYDFEEGLIDEPVRYRTGLSPAPGLSARDKKWVKTFYPRLTGPDHRPLRPFEAARLQLEPAEQANFTIKPDATRNYSIATFGRSDTVMVLFENADGDLRYVTADDDSGLDYNANIRVKLFAGRNYVLRIRLYYRHRAGDLAAMMW